MGADPWLYRTERSLSGERSYNTIVEGVLEAWDARNGDHVCGVNRHQYILSRKGVQNIIHDLRDPKIIDTELGVAHFTNPTGDTIATMVSFGNHPEVLTGSSLGITSDFTDATRRGVEDGIVYPNQEIPVSVVFACMYPLPLVA